MEDEITKGAADPRSFEERVFARVDKADERLDALETRVTSLEESGARSTSADLRLDGSEAAEDSLICQRRPIWESVQYEISRLHATIDRYERTKEHQRRQFTS